MLRQATTSCLRQISRNQKSKSSVILRLIPSDAANRQAFTTLFRHNHNLSKQILSPLSSSTIGLRSLSNKAKGETTKKNNDAADADTETAELVLTPGEKVAAASRLTMWAGIFTFASVCAYYIGKELIPTKMSPNTVFNKASKTIRENSQVKLKYGDSSIKFYGKDHGGHREGRRNFIEHTQYNNEEDGSKRTRVRFNMEGQFASAFCFAEVSNEMSSGEFVYILVQDKKSGRVITVVDNIAALTAKRLSGNSQESADAMKKLLGGNNN
jgi:import inner membrane translocase subunit TIM21